MQQFVDLGRAEEPRQRRPFPLQLVPDLRVVRHPAPRPDVQHGLPPGRVIRHLPVRVRRVPLVPPAAPLRQQHHEVDEGEPEAPHEHRLSGGQRRQVTVRGEVGRQMDESVGAGVLRQFPLFVVEFGVQMTECEDDEVREQRTGAPLQPHLLTPFTRTTDPQRPQRVVVDGDPLGQVGHGTLVHPAQILALGPSVREDPPVEARPLVQGGPLPHGPLHPHRLVREHGDVLGLRVHPQQRRLVRPPDTPGTRRMRIDEMDVEAHAPIQLTGVGGEPLDQSGTTRPGPDDHQGGPHGMRGQGGKGGVRRRGRRHAKGSVMSESNTGAFTRSASVGVDAGDRAPQQRSAPSTADFPLAVKVVRTVSATSQAG